MEASKRRVVIKMQLLMHSQRHAGSCCRCCPTARPSPRRPPPCQSLVRRRLIPFFKCQNGKAMVGDMLQKNPDLAKAAMSMVTLGL